MHAGGSVSRAGPVEESLSSWRVCGATWWCWMDWNILSQRCSSGFGTGKCGGQSVVSILLSSRNCLDTLTTLLSCSGEPRTLCTSVIFDISVTLWSYSTVVSHQQHLVLTRINKNSTIICYMKQVRANLSKGEFPRHWVLFHIDLSPQGFSKVRDIQAKSSFSQKKKKFHTRTQHAHRPSYTIT